AFAALGERRFASEAPALARRFAANAEAGRRLNPRVARLFDGPPPGTMRDVVRRYAAALGEARAAWQAAVLDAAEGGVEGREALADPNVEALRQVLYAPDAPATVPPVRIGEIETFFDEKTRVELNRLQARVDQWHLQSPVAPPHALVLEDAPIQSNPR